MYKLKIRRNRCYGSNFVNAIIVQIAMSTMWMNGPNTSIFRYNVLSRSEIYGARSKSNFGCIYLIPKWKIHSLLHFYMRKAIYRSKNIMYALNTKSVCWIIIKEIDQLISVVRYETDCLHFNVYTSNKIDECTWKFQWRRNIRLRSRFHIPSVSFLPILFLIYCWFRDIWNMTACKGTLQHIQIGKTFTFFLSIQIRDIHCMITFWCCSKFDGIDEWQRKQKPFATV